MDDFVSKPVHPERLRVTIERLLGRTATAEEPAPVGDAAGVGPAKAKNEQGRSWGARWRVAGMSGRQGPAPVLDRADLSARFADDEQLCADLLRLFRRDALAAIASLREAGEAGDLEALEREAHSLKGAAAYVSARALQRCAEEVERCAQEGAADAIGPLLEQLAAELARLDTEVP
jgi:HPt (histidine-containing phosphotransfer) domain-containing protein